MIVLSTRELALTLFLLWVGLTAGNFLFQVFRDIPEYELAADRSYFQLVAVIVVASLLLRFVR